MKSGLIHRLIICALFATALGACEVEHPIGSTIKGTRIAVLPNNKGVEADKELTGQKPEILETMMNSNWPQAGFDAEHHMPNAAVSDHPQEVWTANVGTGSSSDFKLLARPVALDGRIYTMDAEGTVKAFDAKSGENLWSFDTTPKDSDESEIAGGLGVDGDTVYATTGFGEVVALKVADGSVRWRHTMMNPLRAPPTISEGRVYVVSIDNELQALDARTGNTLWHHNGISESATLMGASSPAVLGDSVVVAYSSGEIYNLRAENGRVSWNYMLTTPTQVGALPAIADIRGLPVIDRGRVYAISHSGRMAAVDHRTGDRVWEAEIGGINTPAAAGDSVFVLTNDGHLSALDTQSGRIVWVQELQKLEDPDDHDSDPVFWTGPIMANGHLWLVNSLGQLVSFSPGDGSILDTVDLGRAAYIAPIVAGGMMYVVTD
ncbi:MAG TPA: PQQ-binding-like beta-propeller repeat protein, partial [Alphaproteobacteria bacterium]|nr:PQQ-binding-like beta-propeller repeat protein [Alphaproteobacteria bacterium]